jgi:Co/Zn/Cd efflux system component
MSAHCGHDHGPAPAADDHAYRRVLWVALAVNAAMFMVEIAAGLTSGSAALKADALDFFADAANYAISLLVLGRAAAWSSRAALVKGSSMLVFGLLVIGDTAYRLATQTVPEPGTMGIVGAAALAANFGVAVLLYRFRNGDSNRRSVWLCTRNDALGNLAVLLAASGVFASGTGWPDYAVAAIMAVLALSGAWQIIAQARGELRQTAAHAH